MKLKFDVAHKSTQENLSRRTDFIFNIKVLFSCEAATSVQIQGIHNT